MPLNNDGSDIEHAVSIDDLLLQAAEDPDSETEDEDIPYAKSAIAASDTLAPANHIHRNALQSVYHDAAHIARERGREREQTQSAHSTNTAPSPNSVTLPHIANAVATASLTGNAVAIASSTNVVATVSSTNAVPVATNATPSPPNATLLPPNATHSPDANPSSTVIPPPTTVSSPNAISSNSESTPSTTDGINTNGKRTHAECDEEMELGPEDPSSTDKPQVFIQFKNPGSSQAPAAGSVAQPIRGSGRRRGRGRGVSKVW